MLQVLPRKRASKFKEENSIWKRRDAGQDSPFSGAERGSGPAATDPPLLGPSPTSTWRRTDVSCMETPWNSPKCSGFHKPPLIAHLCPHGQCERFCPVRNCPSGPLPNHVEGPSFSLRSLMGFKRETSLRTFQSLPTVLLQQT